MITLHQFTMLGKTVPQRTKDGRTYVCSAGYTPDLGLVRIYPLPLSGVPARWGTYRIDVERNPKDSRPESWRLAHDREPARHATANRHFTHVGDIRAQDRPHLVPDRYYVNSIQEANERRLSLAMLRPHDVRIEWTKPGTSKHLTPLDIHQMELFPAWPHDQQPQHRVPRVVFDDDGGHHELQLRDWGAYRLIEKNGSDYAYDHMTRALHLGDRSALLVGNINNQRTAWLVIAVLNILQPQMHIEWTAAS